MEKKILDVTCGAKTIWFNKNHPAAVYCDKRREYDTKLWESADGKKERFITVDPDLQCDFTSLAQEWRAIFKPRQIVEIIDGERVEYADLMWLPSATDVFGPSEDGYWKDEGDNFQLPIFEKERDRVKECGDNGTYPYWLRSVHASNTSDFRYVSTSGSSFSSYAYCSRGFAPGFDI